MARFGATMVRCAGHTLLLGGIASDHIVTKDEEVSILDMVEDTSNQERLVAKWVTVDNPGPRPLLIGSSVSNMNENLIIMGGGAVCFSFGAFWNKGCFSLHLQIYARRDGIKNPCINREGNPSVINLSRWVYLQTLEMVSRG